MPPLQEPAREDAGTSGTRALIDAITGERTLPLDIALFALTPEERAIVEVLLRRPDRQRIDVHDAAGRCRVFRNGHRTRVSLGPVALPDATAQLVIELLAHEREEIEAAQRLSAIRHAAGLREAHSFLEEQEAGASLVGILDHLALTVAHMPPVVHYVRDRQYSSLQPFGNNLCAGRGSPGLFTRLAGQPLATWSVEDLEFVFAAHVLTQAGDYFALEEMNWMQVDTCTLTQYLDGKIAALRQLVFQPLCERGVVSSIVDRARALRHLRDTVARTHVMYRSVTGPAMNKRLKCLAGKEHVDAPLPAQLAAALAQLAGVTCTPQTHETHAHDYLAALAGLAIERHFAKELIDTILCSGLRETGSDFFMSRAPVQLALTNRFASLETSDFYCAVIAREGIEPEAHGLKRSVAEMRWNQSMRMKFNSWKFWYGALEPEERSPAQYWFFPALLPDIAYSENAIHPGHRENGIVQSIRAPYPLTLADLRAGVPAGGHRLVPSACDVRGARISAGQPYDDRDLLAAIRHGRWMSIILQRFADQAAATGHPVVIDFFGRDFFFAEEETKKEGGNHGPGKTP